MKKTAKIDFFHTNWLLGGPWPGEKKGLAVCCRKLFLGKIYLSGKIIFFSETDTDHWHTHWHRPLTQIADTDTDIDTDTDHWVNMFGTVGHRSEMGFLSPDGLGQRPSPAPAFFFFFWLAENPPAPKSQTPAAGAGGPAAPSGQDFWETGTWKCRSVCSKSSKFS